MKAEVLTTCVARIEKQNRYLELVEKRKNCRLCDSLGVTNPSACAGGVYDDSRHIGPWTQWQGNLNAELMVVAQDWGGTEYYIEHKGREEDDNITNKRVCELLASIGTPITLPKETQVQRLLFFTNSVLCLRPGRLTGPPIKSRCFANCSTTFLRPQVELVNPKVVVSLGYMAYRSLMLAYGKIPKTRMREAVEGVIPLTERISLVPVFHPGNNGTRSRSLANQKEDWRRVRTALDR